MKVITYNLNQDGTVPLYIVNGGHFSIPNNLSAPADWTYVGIATDEASGESFDVETLKDYLQSIGASNWKNSDGTAFNINEAASRIFELN